ncbi:MAG: hypothetical protein ACOCVV_04505 [Marinobacter sp.]
MTVLRLLMFVATTLLTAHALAHSTLSDVSDGDEERVTLQVMPESKLLIHDTTGINVSSPDGPVQSLPLAVFLTLKSPDKVLAWYREALPDYTVLKGESGEQVQILERTGDDTRVDSLDTYQTPNVRIRPTDARMVTHMKGAKTMIQVYYPPREQAGGSDGEDS